MSDPTPPTTDELLDEVLTALKAAFAAALARIQVLEAELERVREEGRRDER